MIPDIFTIAGRGKQKNRPLLILPSDDQAITLTLIVGGQNQKLTRILRSDLERTVAQIAEKYDGYRDAGEVLSSMDHEDHADYPRSTWDFAELNTDDLEV